ncbi:MAG: hypothetical protein IT209_03170 [Armatimonadetes bacterium]|nr:hypothetical protein [Armatimonadota bacterium]
MDSRDIMSRLAVIEARLQDALGHLVEIRRHVPGTLISHTERIASVERAQRSLVWGLAAAFGGFLSAFVAHIFGGLP